MVHDRNSEFHRSPSGPNLASMRTGARPRGSCTQQTTPAHEPTDSGSPLTRNRSRCYPRELQMGLPGTVAKQAVRLTRWP